MISPLFFWMKGKRNDETPSPTKRVAEKSVKQEKLPPETSSNKNMPNKNVISTETIKELREQTGVSIMQCKKALEEAGGDFEKALVILRKKSGEFAAKKNDRTFHAGVVQAYIHANGTVGAIVELNCETDFVANNEGFKSLARDIAMHVTAANPKFLKQTDITEADQKAARGVFEAEVAGKPEAVKKTILDGKLKAYFSEMVLLDQPFIKDSSVTIQGLLDQATQKFGEKTAIGKFSRIKVLEA